MLLSLNPKYFKVDDLVFMPDYYNVAKIVEMKELKVSKSGSMEDQYFVADIYSCVGSDNLKKILENKTTSLIAERDRCFFVVRD